MMLTIRMAAEDFIGTEHEELVWTAIAHAKKSCPQGFAINIRVSDDTDLNSVVKALSNNASSLQLKTVVKSNTEWERHGVWLDVLSDKDSFKPNSRFVVESPAPMNIIESMFFIINHYKMMSSGVFSPPTIKKQKRNDSSTFDR